MVRRRTFHSGHHVPIFLTVLGPTLHQPGPQAHEHLSETDAEDCSVVKMTWNRSFPTIIVALPDLPNDPPEAGQTHIHAQNPCDHLASWVPVFNKYGT